MFRRASLSSSALLGAVAVFVSASVPRAVAQDGGVRDGGASAADASPPDSGVSDVITTPDAAPAAPLALEPPRLVESPSPDYPPEHMAEGTEPTVVLHVLVGADGNVRDVHVEQSMGADFDASAVLAVQRWTFAPARRGEQPVASRVRIAVHFTLPEVEVTQPDESPFVEDHPEPAARRPRRRRAPDAAGEDAAGDTPEFGARATADVAASERRDQRAGSDVVVDRDLLEAAPHSDAGGMLNTAPGIYVARPEGDAVAHQIMLRGFDAEHGQDLEINVGGVPVNQPSHIHGQGYADLGFVMPEVVRSLRVTEGVYDPAQGDFAVAGSIALELGMRDRGLFSRSTYGSFGTFRQFLAFAPRGGTEDTFAAVALRNTSGFGVNRAGQSGTAIAQYGFGFNEGAARWHGTLSAVLHGARAGLAGVVRLDDVERGAVDFYGSYPDATANAQSALSSRLQLGARLERRAKDRERLGFGLWLTRSDFRIRSNFTGYRERSIIDPTWVGRGDLVEQSNGQTSIGFRAAYRLPEFVLASWARGTIELGTTARLDLIEQRQNLLAAPQNETWDRRVDAGITGADVGVFADVDWRFTRYLRVRGGFRADTLYYDIDDRLGNFIPPYRTVDYVVGYRRTALGLAAGPRVSIEVAPLRTLSFFLAYGEGYRSPQARTLEEGESAPYAKVRSGDLGLRWRAGKHEELTLTAAGYLTALSADAAFQADQARLEPIGPTTRVGGVLYLVARPWKWFTSGVSLTVVRATLDAPPLPTNENPNPPYRDGQLIPYVPPVVLRVDVGVRGKLARFGGGTLEGRVGLGFSYLSSRPLPYGDFADPVALLDASASLKWRWFELGVEAYNLFDAQYAATPYSFVSSWSTSAIPSRLPAEHASAGAPLTIMGTLGVTL